MKNEDADFGWGVVVNFCKKSNVKVSRGCRVTCMNPLEVTVTNVDVTLQASTDSEPLYVVEVLLHCSKDSVKDAATEAARPAAAGETGEMQVGEGKGTISTLFHDLGRKFVTLQFSQIAEISSLESRQSILKRSNLKFFQSVLVLCHQSGSFWL